MELKIDDDYEDALREVSPYFDAEPALNSLEGERFEMLCLLIEEYEKKYHPL